MNGRSDSNQVRRVGERGLLVELGSNASVHAAARAARERFGDELQEVVPGHNTVLLVWTQAAPQADALMSDLNVLAGLASTFKSDMEQFGSSLRGSVTVPVTYDGPDLEGVAGELGLSVEALTELHSGIVFRVAFMGFAPGFPYLIADAPETGNEEAGGQRTGAGAALLALPRLANPRTEVPAGSVAVAAGYCGIYPRSSPGGWNLLGRTDAVLFDAARARPALLEPGMEVRFVAR